MRSAIEGLIAARPWSTLDKVVRSTPNWAAASPASACFRNSVICSSVNRLFASDLLPYDRILILRVTQNPGDVE
jgi:hypothetical protein